jgi:uncharacterized protein (TIGR03437 family)
MKSILLLFVCALSAFAQSFDATSLKGTYHFVRLAIVGSETGQPIETQNSGGDIVFDGKGAYKLNAQRGVSSGAAADYQNEGTYTVSTNGVVTITDAANNWNWNVRLSADSAVLIGSSTEAPDGTRDLFIGIRAANWQDGPPAVHVSGSYAGASFLLPDGLIDGLTTSFVEFNADGAGGLSAVVATGQSSNRKNLTSRQTIDAAQYRLASDGAGSIAFGESALLLAGSRQIFVSSDGEILLGFSPDAGRREILVAVRRSASQSTADWRGRWWIGEMLADNDLAGAVRLESSVGVMEADGSGVARMSQRQDPGQLWRDVTATNYVALGSDGSAQFGPVLEPGRSNLAVGSSSFVSVEVGATGAYHRVHGILFGTRAPLEPTLEVRNAASLAPSTAPISAGELITLYGSSLANSTAAAPDGKPIFELSGASVTINTAASALLFVAPGQINLQTPDGLRGTTALVSARNGNALAKSVTVPLSSTGPGIFTQDGSGAGLGTILHADGRLVSPNTPVAPGEIVSVFVTGLGAVAAVPGSLFAFVGEYQAVVLSADPVPRMLGVYRVQVAVPSTAIAGNSSPFALGSASAFTSMADIAVH